MVSIHVSIIFFFLILTSLVQLVLFKKKKQIKKFFFMEFIGEFIYTRLISCPIIVLIHVAEINA